MTEPLFTTTSSQDTDMQAAYEKAASTILDFIGLVKRNNHSITMAKLRFRDPYLSEQHGQDQFIYLWLNEIIYHEEDNLLSGVFFELPQELEQWHQVGERLGFEPEGVFDWCAIQSGCATGGFTLQVARSHLKTDQQKKEYDALLGIHSFA